MTRENVMDGEFGNAFYLYGVESSEKTRKHGRTKRIKTSKRIEFEKQAVAKGCKGLVN